MSRRMIPILLLLAGCEPGKVSLDSGGDTEPVLDTTPPSVTLDSPRNGESLGSTIAFSATASDDVGVESVGFLVDGSVAGEATAEPWTLNWDASGLVNGNYDVAAVARDAAGNEGSATAQVTIEHEGGLPIADVRITAPMEAATLCGTVAVVASVSEEVAEVTFALDGSDQATVSAAPFTWDWDTTAVANGLHTLRATGVAADGRAAQHTLSVDVENTSAPCDNAPSVGFTSPEDGTYGRGVVELAASATDDQGVVKVQFFVDSGMLLEDTSVPYGLDWDTDDFAEGGHTLQAVAFDTAGQSSEAELTFSIDRTSPTVTFTSPGEGDTIRGTEVVTVDAEDDAFLEWVTLQVDGVDVETLTEAPWSWALDTSGMAWGPHTLSVSARDGAGNAATDTVDVVLDNPPDVTWVTPMDGDTVSGVVTVDVSASDDEGVASVQVYVDGSSLGTALAEPYSFVWDTCGLARGTHELLAEATDLAGGTSSATVTVDNNQPLAVALGAVENDPSTSPVAYVVDDDGGVTVVFDLDGTVIDTVTTSSGAGDALGDCASTAYVAQTWGSLGVTSGTYVLGATATNTAGDTVTTTVSITLDADLDGDGHDATAWGGDDCDDTDATVSPTASEATSGTCNGLDDDCDGRVDEDYDADGDGAASVSTCGGDLDCDDADSAVYPGATEICGDGIDQDCSTAAVCGGSGELSLDDQAKITGESSIGQLGARVWATDVDDDGYPDALFSIPEDDDGGADAGAVVVVFGPTFADISESAADVKLVGEDTDDFVRAVASGDFDGDGAVDLILGAPYESTGGSYAGAAYIVSGPITGDIDLSRADAKLYGEDSSDDAGWEVRGGDFDGDGLDDAVISAYGRDVSTSITNAGVVYVVYGSLSGTVDLATADASLVGEATDDRAGRSLTVGDLDGDGVDDLLVGATTEDSGGASAGAVYLLLGAQTGEVDLADADTKLIGEYAGDQAGASMALGDIDGDGNADLVVGARASNTAASGAGGMYVVAGPLAAGTVDLSTAFAVANGVAYADYAGTAVGVVDYDGDGADDVLVGVPNDDTGVSGGGAVCVLFGPLAGTTSLSASDATLYGVASNGEAGSGVYGLDMDLDGYGDVVIGAPGEDGPWTNSGAGYVAFGGPGE